MKKLQLSLCAVGAYVVLIVAFAMFGGRSATGQGQGTPFQNVVVTNTGANPVPTTVQGTIPVGGTVGIDPTANTVQIDGTPSVQISGTPTVKVVPGSAKPFHRTLFGSTVSSPGTKYKNVTTDLLVIDYVSGAADDKLGLHINIGSLGPTYFFGGFVDTNGFTIVSEMTRIYVSPGDEISTGADSKLDISGHFEPIAP